MIREPVALTQGPDAPPSETQRVALIAHLEAMPFYRRATQASQALARTSFEAQATTQAAVAGLHTMLDTLRQGTPRSAPGGGHVNRVADYLRLVTGARVRFTDRGFGEPGNPPHPRSGETAEILVPYRKDDGLVVQFADGLFTWAHPSEVEILET